MSNRPLWSLAPFDLTKQKKKTFVVQDAIEDSAESHGRHIIRCLIFIYGSQEVKEEEVFDIFCLPELFFHSLNLDFEDYVPHILFILMVVRGYIAEHPNDEEEVEGIDLHQQRYPWEGSDMVYLYDEVSISLDGLRSIFESRRLGYIAEHPNDEEEVEGIDLHQQRYPWEGSDMDYLYDEVSISLDGLRSIFESRRLSADPIVEVNMQCVDLEIIIWKLHFERHKFEPYRGYITEHPNDEEEVEGIDLHQQRYPWEGSDMDYLYDESSFAQLLSMELTLEIDGAIFHVPNANVSSNVDSQL
ncbi:hypothetical protein F2Q68_00023794 [Brassica cretica]|uniref:Uncharacterized protein n=1 Tax=Brassica cretica TaxID=69181 RepID=A0A8S9IBY3_BRACR|nr:hypothetical protein F2Q68_00023794 [Brassica cretica]